MAHFLRDQQITNSTVDEDSLRQIAASLENRKQALNAHIPPTDVSGKEGLLSYVIRFDNKGYRLFSIEEVLRYFHQAKEVERIVFNIDTGESLASNRSVGTYLELQLDTKEPNRCYVVVTSNEGDWVDASISAIQDVIVKCKNKNGWVRTAWTQLTVQVIGVALGFILSLWISAKIAPKLAIQNSFVITFLFMLLMFSNVWMFLSQRILFFVNGLFPNINFCRPRKDRMHWLMKTIVGGLALAVGLYAIGWLAFLLGDVLHGLVPKSP
jgi:hypothetical protein